MQRLILPLFLLCIISLSAQNNVRYINVNGTAEVTVQADQIDFNIQVRIVNESLEESKRQNDLSTEKILTVLTKLGINKSDIKASPVTFGKQYEYINARREEKGFFAATNISFVLKDLSKYYELSNELATVKEIENINSNYTTSRYEENHQLAYEKALRAAKEKAGYMAKALDIKAGKVLEVDEYNMPQPYTNMANFAAEKQTRYDPAFGKVTIKRSVRVKFELVD